MISSGIVGASAVGPPEEAGEHPMRLLVAIPLVLGCQLLAYLVFLRPRIARWGATEEELRMPLAGDVAGPRIGASTRAITIEAPSHEVWDWIIQLGADRGGFFSYSLIEKALGYDKSGTDLVPQFHDMPVGRVVPASLEGARRLIDFSFPVLAVEPGRSFVLESWGTFHLEELGPDRTRLIVRTTGRPPSGPASRIADVLGAPAHYLMERRMLLGFKARAEAGPGVPLPTLPDSLWLLGMLLSGIGVGLLALLGTGVAGTASAVVLGLAWLVTLLVAPPRPASGLGLLLVVVTVSALVAAA